MLNLFTAKYLDDSGRWLLSLRSIVGHYAGRWLLIDLVSIIPFDLLSLGLKTDAMSRFGILRTVRLLRLMKLVRVLKGARYVRVVQCYSERSCI